MTTAIAIPKPTVKPAPATTARPYNRKDWPHWIDEDGDCQNTRQELLIATSKLSMQFKNDKRCTVIYGQWHGVYTGKTFTKASDVDIDHVVPLAHAHRHGADTWTKHSVGCLLMTLIIFWWLMTQPTNLNQIKHPMNGCHL